MRTRLDPGGDPSSGKQRRLGDPGTGFFISCDVSRKVAAREKSLLAEVTFQSNEPQSISAAHNSTHPSIDQLVSQSIN